MLGVKGFCEIGGMVNSQTTTGVMNGATTKMVAEAESQRMIELARFAGQIVQIGGWRVDLDPFQVHWTPETAAIHERPDLLRLKFQVQHPEPAGHRMLRWTDEASTSAARNVA